MVESIIKNILEASFTAGIAAIAVMLLRIPMKAVPKRWSYILWAVVFFRCLCPFSLESAVSLFNLVPMQNTFDQDISYNISIINSKTDYYGSSSELYDDSVYVDYSGNADFNKTVPYENPNAERSGNTLDVIFAVWAAGAAVMTLYAVVSYSRLRKKLKTAVKTDDGIYETDLISTAFSAGFFPPKIYIPCSFSKKERELIIVHERVHIKRFDYIFNPLAFIGLTIHWFNPLIWIAFIFMTRDMELSCDEAVLETLGLEKKTAYSETLLQVSVRRSGLTIFPPAFAETGIKARVKNVLGYKKPRLIGVILSGAIVLTACAVLGTDAVGNSDGTEYNEIQDNGTMYAAVEEMPEADDRQQAAEQNFEYRIYSMNEIIFPAHELDKTEYNSQIFEIPKFTASFALPSGWTTGIPADGEKRFSDLLWSPMNIYNENNELMGTIGFNTFEIYDDTTEENYYRMVYNQLMLGSVVNWNEEYTPIKTDPSGETAATKVRVRNDETREETYYPAVLAYDKDLLVYIGMQFDVDAVTEQQLFDIAGNVTLVSYDTASLQ